MLPTFDVNIEMEKNFILPTDDDVRGVVKAEYRYCEFDDDKGNAVSFTQH